MNVHISLTVILVPLSILALLLVIYIILKDRKAPEVQIPWNKANRIRLFLILGPLPIQAILLASGEPHGITDKIGVVMCILQCFLIPLIIRPYAPDK